MKIQYYPLKKISKFYKNNNTTHTRTYKESYENPILPPSGNIKKPMNIQYYPPSGNTMNSTNIHTTPLGNHKELYENPTLPP